MIGKQKARRIVQPGGAPSKGLGGSSRPPIQPTAVDDTWTLEDRERLASRKVPPERDQFKPKPMDATLAKPRPMPKRDYFRRRSRRGM